MEIERLERKIETFNDFCDKLEIEETDREVLLGVFYVSFHKFKLNENILEYKYNNKFKGLKNDVLAELKVGKNKKQRERLDKIINKLDKYESLEKRENIIRFIEILRKDD